MSKYLTREKPVASPCFPVRSALAHIRVASLELRAVPRVEGLAAPGPLSS